MKHIRMNLALMTMLALAACGGGDAASDAAADDAPATDTPASEPSTGDSAGEMTTPEWFRIDESAMTVELDIVAQQDGGWKFNGIANGDATVYVPVGYTVTLNFQNDDPGMVHSVGVSSIVSNFPSTFDDVEPVFEGALTSNPTSMTEATAPGESETITFVADTVGEYSLVCFIIAHAVSGMWMGFEVTDGPFGVGMM